MSTADRHSDVLESGDASVKLRLLIGTYRSNILTRTNYVGQVGVLNVTANVVDYNTTVCMHHSDVVLMFHM